jgi:hypothetical protein
VNWPGRFGTLALRPAEPRDGQLQDVKYHTWNRHDSAGPDALINALLTLRSVALKVSDTQ